MKFRLNKLQVHSDNYQTDVVEFVNHKNDKSSNHFSLIVGNNGTGKSRLLGNIVRKLKRDYSDEPIAAGVNAKNKTLFSVFESSGTPSKLVAVSNSISDKFPIDHLWDRNSLMYFNYREERYNYLGTRSRIGTHSLSLIRRAIDILLENYSNEHVSRCYRHVFSYLDYRPIIKLEYKTLSYRYSSRYSLELPKGYINSDQFIEYVNKTLDHSVYKDYKNNFIYKYSERLDEVRDFFNFLRSKDHSTYDLEINFSSENINRIVGNKKLYDDDFRIYEILTILRKLGLVSSPNVKLFKHNDASFSFSDASSGEANILTTLISLIPLVEDNCCVLIDEPELSLHPIWQYKYIELLTKIFDNFSGCHIIIASHSHFIVSDLPIGNSSVITLKKEKNQVTSTLLPESTFGWSAEDILLNVFDMPTTRNHYVSVVVSEALELIGNGEKSGKRFTELKASLYYIKTSIKDEDPLKLVINTILSV